MVLKENEEIMNTMQYINYIVTKKIKEVNKIELAAISDFDFSPMLRISFNYDYEPFKSHYLVSNLQDKIALYGIENLPDDTLDFLLLEIKQHLELQLKYKIDKTFPELTNE